MSFLIEYKKGELVQSQMLYKRSTPCPSYQCKDGLFCVGEIFEQNLEDITNSDWEKNPDILNAILGDIAIVKAEAEKCKFAVDMCGIDNLYYYHKEDHFLLSDNIWDIVNVLEPKLEDINASWVRRNMVFGTVDGETFIKGLKVLMPCESGVYDATANSLFIKEYREFRYSGEVESIDEAVETMDFALNQMFRELKMHFGSECVYGMGLSGGLDSRVIPFYAKKHGLNLISWNVCTQRPNGIFEASSVKSARKLAVEYEIPFAVVEWKKDKLLEKLHLKTVNMPLGTSGRNEFKYESEGIPKFDVMLSGGFGVIVGDYFPVEIPTLDKEGLKIAMRKMFATLQSTSTKGRVKRAINYIFGMNLKVNDEGIPADALDLFRYEIQENLEYVDRYVEERFGRYSNVDIWGSYWLRYVCTRDRNGAFESMFGTKRSIATYCPFIFKQIIRWNSNLLPGRQVLPALIKAKMPSIATIGTDSYTAAPNKTTKILSRIGSIWNRLIRGNGTAIDENNFDSKTISLIEKCLNNECEWFYKIADTRKFHNEILSKKQLRFVAGIWEMKYLIDFIEKKGYQDIEH